MRACDGGAERGQGAECGRGGTGSGGGDPAMGEQTRTTVLLSGLARILCQGGPIDKKDYTTN